MKKLLTKWHRILAPRATILVSTVNREGVSNAAPFSFVMPVSIDPPLIAFASVEARHTLKNIRATGEFVVNIPSVDLLRETWICGKSFPEGVSEIEQAGLTAVPSEKVRSPRIKECLANLECLLEAEYQAGDHWIVVGRIAAIGVREGLFDGEAFDLVTAQPLMHVSSKDFASLGEVMTYTE
ncbi:MAG: flavin reductase family protein [Candidatus Omnitrophica bacterium]|nr:flavin reductase family protein [Candidatus Omnitrophota bacterium]